MTITDTLNWHGVMTRGGMYFEERGDGAQLWYGGFGRDTYSLYTEVDGETIEFCIRAEQDDDHQGQADELLARLATGWRPANWASAKKEM